MKTNLNKFEQSLKDALNKHEAGYDSNVWDEIANQLNNQVISSNNSFENTVKDKVNHHEATYDASVWASISSALDKQPIINTFENTIQDKLNNHEAVYNASVWASISSALDKQPINTFEDTVKETLNSYETSYNPNHWTPIANALGKKPFGIYKWIAGGIIAAGIITAIALYPYNDNNNNSENNNLVVNNNKTQNNNLFSENDKNNTINNVEDNNSISNKNNVIDNSTINNDEVENNHINNQTINETTNNSNNNNDNSAIENNLKKDNNTNNSQNNHNPYLHNNTAGSDVNNVDNNSATTNNTNTPQPLTLNIVSDINTICEGGTVNVAVQEVQEGVTYNIQYKNKTVNDITAGFLMNEAGKQIITITATRGDEQLIEEKYITVNSKPEVRIEIEEDKYSLINNRTFSAITNAKKVTWNLGDGTTSTELEFNHTYAKTGKYKVDLLIESENGCAVQHTKTITNNGYYNILKDRFFTPNGDGIVDNFIPVELKEINLPFELKVLNRQNQVVYTTTNVNQAWNGIDQQTGQLCPDGSYVWVLTLTNEKGIDETYLGNVVKHTDK